MKIEVAGAEGDGQSDGPRSSAFMLVEHASLYMLACGAGDAPRNVLDTLRGGFSKVQAAPGAADDEAMFSALTSLYAGVLIGNDLVRGMRQAGEDVGVSFLAVALRGGSLCIARAGGVRVSRIGRGGVEHLIDAAQPEPEKLPLGLLPKSAVWPFVGAWDRGDILVLARSQLVDTLGVKVVARTVLETTSLAEAAAELAAGRGAVVLVRWIR
jgi:hypothetical protein